MFSTHHRLRMHSEVNLTNNEPAQNDVSSTKVRLMRKRDLSLRYIVPEPVIEYIQHYELYKE